VTEGVRRVVERPAVQVRLAAVAALLEGNRVDVHPPTEGAQLDPGRQPVGLRRVPQPTERRQAAAKIPRVDGKVEIAVWAGLPAGQGSHPPPAAHPVPHPGLVQRVQDLDDVHRLHLPTLRHCVRTRLAWYAPGVYNGVMDYMDHVAGELAPAGR
jgi:hypothetical protein